MSRGRVLGTSHNLVSHVTNVSSIFRITSSSGAVRVCAGFVMVVLSSIVERVVVVDEYVDVRAGLTGAVRRAQAEILGRLWARDLVDR